MLTVAFAKGRTLDALLPHWREAGIEVPADLDESRALVFEVESQKYDSFRYLLAKPVDVPAYVAYGVADLGVVGKDVLLEDDKDMYELLDLGVAKCKLCIAGPKHLQHKRPERVATKYPKLADAYFRSQGQAVEIVPLSGSIELAAVIGLTDRIFDLVQTGETLRANGLLVFDEVYEISARLVANRSSYRLKRNIISEIVAALEPVCKRTEG